MTRSHTIIAAFAFCMSALCFVGLQRARSTCTTGLEGWAVLGDRYRQSITGPIDGITFQWDYFMVHDDDFTGSIGYVIADPRHKMVGLMPSGGNAAIAGLFITSGHIAADYVNFGTEAWAGPGSTGYSASADIREFHAESGSSYAHIIPVTDNNSLILRGRTPKYAWDLTVSQDWRERCTSAYSTTFPPPTDYDIASIPLFPEQQWTVDMNWMRTHVTGTITNKTVEPPQTVTISGHGYREQAWGPWAFHVSGWDFAIVSDNRTGVQWALQTYHDSELLDYLDISFYDTDGLKAVRFKAAEGELGWYHSQWLFDESARQCVPADMTVIAQNSEYIVEAFVDIGDSQVAMLSDITPITKNYFIECRFPWISGTIYHAATGEKITDFSGQGGGEFSAPRLRQNEALSAEQCGVRGGAYTSPLPYGCVDLDGDGYGYAGSPECPFQGRDCNDSDPGIDSSGCSSDSDESTQSMRKKIFRMMIMWFLLRSLLP